MMYDKFVESDELTTRELLELGFKNHDLTKFIEQGQLKRVKRGFYTVAAPEQMLFFVNYLVSKKNKDRARKVLFRTQEFFPNDQLVASRVFSDAIFNCDYKCAFENLDLMMETENENYMQDQKFWLYLLSIVTEVPDKYKDKVIIKVENMKIENIKTNAVKNVI